MPARPVVVNSTPLVAFWAVGRLDILRSLFGEVVIPPAVREEFLSIETEARGKVLQAETWIRVVNLENPHRVGAFATLDEGEAQVLALAEEQHASLVLIDERKARQYARRLKLPMSGTLGVLLLAKEEHAIQAVAPLVEALQEAGLYLHPELIEQVLQMAGEG
jgi:predicted nucleic acid-binding protein